MPTLRTTMREFLDGWREDVASSWRSLLDGVEPSFEAIDASLQTRADEVVFPGRKGEAPPGARSDTHVFRALDGIVPSQVRVVVVGQDPYPRVAEATGRAFEQGDLTEWTSRTPRVAPSLKRVLQEVAHLRTGRTAYRKAGGWRKLVEGLEAGDPAFDPPRSVFDSWQAQGVLFLNTGLTLTRYKMGGHPHQVRGHIPMWAPVVGALCQRLAQRNDIPLVFLSWGSKARAFLASCGVLRTRRRPAHVVSGLEKTAVVDRSHPAVHQFFEQDNLFAEANDRLEEFGAASIDW